MFQIIINQLKPKQMISIKILLLFIHIHLQIYASSKINLAQISQTLLLDDWQSVQEKLMAAQSIQINYSGLTQYSLLKILSLELPKLKVLTFGNYHFDASQPNSLFKSSHHQYLTHRLFDQIFSSQYLQGLIELNLIGTNLDDKYFQCLQKIDWSQRTLKLEKLLIGSNYIGSKGFQYLERLPLSNLKHLDLSGNLLVEATAVTSIIKILCGDVEENCSKSIESLDVSSTNINSSNLIRLLKVINPGELVSLNISGLNLHQGKKYQDGFHFQFYQFVANLSFPNIKILAMADLALDSKVVHYLSNWSFPELDTLILHLNFIDDQCIQKWLTNRNFPQLTRLLMAGTDIKDEGLRIITSQKFNLKQINIGVTLVSNRLLKYFTQIKTANLQKIFLKSLNLQSKSLRLFFEQNSFENLVELSLTNNQQIQNIFEYFPWNKLKRLQKLILTDCTIENSISYVLNSSSILLPRLQYLMLDGADLNSHQITSLSMLVHKLFPSIKYVNMVQKIYQPINFTLLSTQDILSQIGPIIDLGYVMFRFTSKNQNKKIQMLQIQSFNWLFLYSSKHELISYIQPPSGYWKKLSSSNDEQLPEQRKLVVVKEMASMISISQLSLISIAKQTEWQLFTSWLEIQGINVLPQLITLFINIPLKIIELSNFLKNLRVPQLRNLRITLNITADDDDLQSLLPSFQDMVQLVDLRITFSYQKGFKIKKDRNKFLNKLKYPFLIQIDLSQNSLETQEIGGILYNHSHTLRFLKVTSNFIQQSFLKMIAQFNIILKVVDISFVTFSPQQFSQFGRANFGFMTQLRADKCGLTDQHISKFVNLRNKVEDYFFPKMARLSLNENEIHQMGFRILFEQQMWQLISLRIKRNRNPHFLNMMLSYTTKINEVVATDVEIYALDKDILPISTRRILIFALQTYAFSREDYDILGSLNFQRLKVLQIQARNIQDCKILQYLLRISLRAKTSWIAIRGQDKKFNSSCLSSTDEIKLQSEVEELAIWQSSDQTYLPQFVEIFLTSAHNWKQILLFNLRLPPQIFLKIRPQSLGQLRKLFLGSNYLNDQGFQQIMQSPLQNLQSLQISDTDITIKSFRLLKDREFDSLETLDISGIELGDEGIEIIASLKLHKLKLLQMNRCQIRNLSKLNTMYFPQIYQLNIRLNDFSVRSFVNFIANLNRTGWPNLWKVDAKGIIPTVEQMKQIQNILKNINLKIIFDLPEKIGVSNSAIY